MRFPFHRGFFRSQDGASLVEMALVTPVLLLILLGTVEFGRVWYLDNEMAGAAQAGAVYGSQYPKDTSGMQNVAKDDASDVSSASDISNLTASAAWGCECSDGTQASASCSTKPSGCTYNVVDYVTVTISATYTPMLPWPGLPSTIPISQTVVMNSYQ